VQALAGWQREAAAAYADPHSARLGSLALAYPEFTSLLPAVEAGWAAGTTRAHLVPFNAINPPGGAPQVGPGAVHNTHSTRTDCFVVRR
jgi:hypothetical protein